MTLPFYRQGLPEPSKLRQVLNQAYRMDEKEAVRHLLEYLDFSSTTENTVHQLAVELVQSVREHNTERNVIEAFMLQYDLSMEEGVLMMCLAEALLRVPDKETERLLLKDKLTSAQWNKHIGDSESAFVNMATWGLALSGKILQSQVSPGTYFKSIWQKLLRHSGEPVIRKAVREAMKILSKQFVIGQDIHAALKASVDMRKRGYCFSYDMLGEAARTQADADRYFKAYFDAITAIGGYADSEDVTKNPSISVKLSALHPRYEYSQREVVVPYLIQRVKKLVLHAKEHGISFTIDAEEADRLEMSLDIIEAIFADSDFANWEGLGLAMQAYQKRAFAFIDWLIDLSRRYKKRIQVRLVKGAYWDTEIKLSQVEGFVNYPVFTRKSNTDLSYLACAKKMLLAQEAIYPQFATHNAYSVAAILTLLAENKKQHHLEFQSLQGMGRALHDEIVSKAFNFPCRIYAPVGSHKDLLPYLVRRLLENGANSSFVNRIADAKTPIEQLVASPIAITRAHETIFNPRIPLPAHLYGESRLNSEGLDLSNILAQQSLAEGFARAAQQKWTAASFLRQASDTTAVYNPADTQQVVGHVEEAHIDDVDKAMQVAADAYPSWTRTAVEKRAEILRHMADLLESHKSELMYLAVNEAGKTLHDANAEVREAIDFCRYYASQAERVLTETVLPGPTGEYNALRMRGRGVILCISPWNFPLAIFTGQVVAALVAGNTVVAKPAEQTPLIAALAVKLFYQAGLPENVLQLVLGRGETIGAALVQHPRLAGVMFTGSTETARGIAVSLANRSGAILPLIAETGGMNAMIADSTALPEQLIRDVLSSAFGSAGQRCSALRVLYLQEDIADHVMQMLSGAMAELSVGNPLLLCTDVGPVIDENAKTILLTHAERMRREARLIYQVSLSEQATRCGHFVAPQAFELPALNLLKREVFGPMLHVLRYRASDLAKVVDEINSLGYGLTFGIQSRINTTIDYLQDRIEVGNTYVNRNTIGAVVGVQPFGGSGLSGTGPKAGGPHYLPRLCQESTLTVDTTAVGGNASLMAMEE